MSTPSQRLREERLRLGYNQKEFGALGGVQKLAQFKYEQGERKPDVAYLEGIAKAGADVGYIITGQPAEFLQKLAALSSSKDWAAGLGGTLEEQAANMERIFNLALDARERSSDENLLIDNYRRCEPDDQAVIQRMASLLAKPQKQKA